MGEISDTSASGGYKKTGVHVLKLTSGERKFIKTQWFIKCLLSCACAAQQAVAVIIGPFPVPLFALCILPCMGHFPYTAINEGRKKGEKSWTFPPPITKREEKREREKKKEKKMENRIWKRLLPRENNNKKKSRDMATFMFPLLCTSGLEEPADFSPPRGP